MDSLAENVKQVKQDYTRLRWAVGLSGVLSVAVGVVILLWPGISLFALTILFGAYMTATGIIALGTAIGGKVTQNRGWLAFGGVLGIVAGLLVLFWPNIGALALLYVIGAYAITFGVIMAGGAFWLPLDGADKALLLFSGFVSILFGIVMFAKPDDGALVVLALIAAFSLVIGVSEIVLAIGGKRIAEARLKNLAKEYQHQAKGPDPQPSS
jgi:uncharacterized membrane protein HdeD (DUF308 family)